MAAQVNLEQVMAWKNGLFYFNHADIQTVMRQISRWYDVEVEYQGVLPVRDFRGKMQRDLQLSQVLKFLEQSDVHFTVTGKKIIVRP
jgi:ferric-dicitrate binding protein FerR (iron transport regulator)